MYKYRSLLKPEASVFSKLVYQYHPFEKLNGYYSVTPSFCITSLLTPVVE